MKKIFLAIIITLFLTISNAYATNVAVIDVEKVVENSIAMKNVNKKLTKKKELMQKELQKEEGVLNAQRDDIASKSSILSKEALDGKMREFQRNVITFQKKVKAEEGKLQNAYMDAVGEITDEIKIIVEEIKSEDKYTFDIAIVSSIVIYSDNSLDISSVVLKRLNKKMKNVVLSI